MSDAARAAAELLLAARNPARRLPRLPEDLRPADVRQAYAIQRHVAAGLGPIGGWKVGAAGPEAPPNCAPMPLSGVSPTPGSVPAEGCPVEGEVAFRLGVDLPPRKAPYGRDEVIAALATAHPAIEWLESRFVDTGTVDKLSMLADSLMHGGFVWGVGIPAWRDIKFDLETVTQEAGGEVLHRVGNPAGDMIRLVQWLADEGAVWAGGLFARQFVTCGSWTGKTAVLPGQAATVLFPSLGTALMT